ncbi:hypothetical protein KKF81_01880 [Candidatus Micrarchaeota archaeon]|nr:hypothetical protein [Candidatus Micrarchaeota archaeon]
MQNKRAAIPKELRALQRPWEIKKEIPQVEKWVRTKTKPTTGTYDDRPIAHYTDVRGRLCGMHLDEKTTDSLKKIAETEYFAWAVMNDPETANAYEQLKGFLDTHNIRLDLKFEGRYTNPTCKPKGLYELILKIMSILPYHHLSTDKFRKLLLGGMPDHYTLEPCYYDVRTKTVNMHETTILGAKRNFIGLFLHEIGHIFEDILPPNDKTTLASIAQMLNPKFAIDYLEGVEKRRFVQDNGNAGQFIAETYLHYVTQGEVFTKFIEDSEAEQREMWKEVNGIYQRNFDGIVYV